MRWELCGVAQGFYTACSYESRAVFRAGRSFFYKSKIRRFWRFAVFFTGRALQLSAHKDTEYSITQAPYFVKSKSVEIVLQILYTEFDPTVQNSLGCCCPRKAAALCESEFFYVIFQKHFRFGAPGSRGLCFLSAFARGAVCVRLAARYLAFACAGRAGAVRLHAGAKLVAKRRQRAAFGVVYAAVCRCRFGVAGVFRHWRVFLPEFRLLCAKPDLK